VSRPAKKMLAEDFHTPNAEDRKLTKISSAMSKQSIYDGAMSGRNSNKASKTPS